ncbi:MAG: rpoD, partial [Ramlibacter sp.]|nr:rpoD [Ramlibacter sp.]
MPAQKSAKPIATKPAERKPVKASAPAPLKVVKSDSSSQSRVPAATKVTKPVPATKSPAKAEKASAKEEAKKPAKTGAAAEEVVKKKPGRPPKAISAESDTAKAATGAKRGRKPKGADPSAKPVGEEVDLADIEAEYADPEPVVEETVTAKVKPLRMKISKAKERALMKEFGLDETVLTEEEMLKRRQRLKMLIKLGKTRGYLTHAE